MCSLGEVALARGDRDAAGARWQAALDLYEEIGAPEAAQISDRLSFI
jgi:hypothetical protein